MAVFNKREVGYIKAIAGVGKHKSFIHRTFNGSLLNNGVTLLPADHANPDRGLSRVNYVSNDKPYEKRSKVLGICLHKRQFAVDATDAGNSINDWTLSTGKMAAGMTNVSTKGSGTDGYMYEMNCLSCPMIAEAEDGKINENGDTTTIDSVTPTDHRVGTEFFLDKTTLKMRLTMPDFGLASSNLEPHFEYRLIIFRTRKPTTTSHTEFVPLASGCSFLNFQYDLFNGPVGRPIGFRGHRRRQDFDGDENYRGHVRQGSTWSRDTSLGAGPVREIGAADDSLTIDEWMTMPLNKADYVIMKDERFFLGTQHGKSHYETIMSFDWNQQGETTHDDLTLGMKEGFSPNWNILILGTSNDQIDPDLNIQFSATTSIESA